MMQLTAIRLVQFFLYEKLDVPIGRTCGVFGANGSGKSSLLDAVQIVMLGGSASNATGVVLNAQAEESNNRSTRSIRSYCLGKYGDAADARVRDAATTYITLIWTDTQTAQVISSGVCIAAAADRDGHDVLGRYLVPGELRMQDHLDVVGTTEKPREWGAFRHQLQQKAGAEEFLFHDAERFVSALLFALRGAGRAPSIDAFRQAFRFGLRMRFDGSVDQIVRNQVLEARPTNTRGFKDVLGTFQEMAAKVREIEERIAESRPILDDFERAQREQVHALAWDALEADAQLEVDNEALAAAEKAQGQAEVALDDAKRAQQQAQQAEAAASAAAAAAAQRRDQHASHGGAALLRDRLGIARTKENERRTALRGDLGSLKRALEVPMPRPGALVGDSDEACAAAAAELGGLLGANAWSAHGIEQAMRRALRAAKAKGVEALSILNDLGTAHTRAKQEETKARANLDSLKQGRRNTRDTPSDALRELLSNAGIEATPVCQLVAIEDAQTWQPVIEAFLGAQNMQALLVDASAERRAFALYRGARIFDAKIVMPSRFTERASPRAGSVAELINGHDAAAVNYLRSKLGDFQRAQSENECFEHRFAMTPDGMIVASAEILRRRPVDPAQFLIGPVTASARSAAEDIWRRAHQNAITAGQQYDEFKPIVTLLLAVSGDESERVRTVMDAFEQLEQSAAAAKDFQRQLDALDTDEYRQLCEAANKASAERDALRSLTLATAAAVGKAQNQHSVLTDNTQDRRAAVQRSGEAATRARSVAGFEDAAAYASEQWDRLLSHERLGSNFAEMARECHSRAGRSRQTCQNAASNAQRLLAVFVTRHRETMPVEGDADWTVARAWLVERVSQLHGTGLKDYKDKMDDALAAAKRTFRTDVAVAINEHIDWLDETVRRMNAALASAPAFTNGERYRFRRPVRPAFDRLYKFVRDVAKFGPEDDLLGGAGEMPPEFDDLMRGKAVPGAAAIKSPLDDYREFFDFDVEVLRENPETGVTQLVDLLSKRMGSGSGGEHRSPLYVIAGAAMASAYRLQRGDDSGVRLLVLDEAFIKMDARNIIATMRYFKELGLQIFLASAGEALGHLNAFLDRYYDIMRDAEANVVLLEGHDVDAASRNLSREDLPEFNPELLEREVQILTASAPA